MYKNFRLIIAGGLQKEDKPYFNELIKLTKDYADISLLPNLPYPDLLNLYKKSKIYIHMTGYGVDGDKNPEQVEHLGITPLEAMASGCLTFCYNAGGPKEIINHKVNGFLFNTERELSRLLSQALNNADLQIKVQKEAKAYVINNFSYDKFKKRVIELIL